MWDWERIGSGGVGVNYFYGDVRVDHHHTHGRAERHGKERKTDGGRTVGRADARGHVLLVVLEAGEAEVDDLELRIGRLRLEKEVLGLQVAVLCGGWGFM